MPRAITFDAMGTLIELEPPAERLHASLGGGVPLERVHDAFAAEISYYREHAIEGSDPDALADLRERCAAVLSEHLGVSVGPAQMMAAVRFRAFEDARPALEAVRSAGIATACVSNWDVSLADALASTGLQGLLDVVVSSAGTGESKPSPGPFRAALAELSCDPAEALHVGDSAEEDVAGASAAGMGAILLDRTGDARLRPPEAPTISSLAEIGQHLPT